MLIRQYLKPLYTFLFRLLGNAQDAEDVAQEVFVKVWRSLKTFDQKKSFKTWAFSIAKNSAIDHLRKKKAIPFSAFETEDGNNALTDVLADPAPLPPELLEKADAAKMLSDAMATLSPNSRMVLLLRYNDHFTFREIGQSLGEPLHTVKSRHRRAILQLRTRLLDH